MQLSEKRPVLTEAIEEVVAFAGASSAARQVGKRQDQWTFRFGEKIVRKPVFLSPVCSYFYFSF